MLPWLLNNICVFEPGLEYVTDEIVVATTLPVKNGPTMLPKLVKPVNEPNVVMLG